MEKSKFETLLKKQILESGSSDIAQYHDKNLIVRIHGKTSNFDQIPNKLKLNIHEEADEINQSKSLSNNYTTDIFDHQMIKQFKEQERICQQQENQIRHLKGLIAEKNYNNKKIIKESHVQSKKNKQFADEIEERNRNQEQLIARLTNDLIKMEQMIEQKQVTGQKYFLFNKNKQCINLSNLNKMLKQQIDMLKEIGKNNFSQYEKQINLLKQKFNKENLNNHGLMKKQHEIQEKDYQLSIKNRQITELRIHIQEKTQKLKSQEEQINQLSKKSQQMLHQLKKQKNNGRKQKQLAQLYDLIKYKQETITKITQFNDQLSQKLLKANQNNQQTKNQFYKNSDQFDKFQSVIGKLIHQIELIPKEGDKKVQRDIDLVINKIIDFDREKNQLKVEKNRMQQQLRKQILQLKTTIVELNLQLASPNIKYEHQTQFININAKKQHLLCFQCNSWVKKSDIHDKIDKMIRQKDHKIKHLEAINRQYQKQINQALLQMKMMEKQLLDSKEQIQNYQRYSEGGYENLYKTSTKGSDGLLNELSKLKRNAQNLTQRYMNKNSAYNSNDNHYADQCSSIPVVHLVNKTKKLQRSRSTRSIWCQNKILMPEEKTIQNLCTIINKQRNNLYNLEHQLKDINLTNQQYDEIHYQSDSENLKNTQPYLKNFLNNDCHFTANRIYSQSQKRYS